MRKVEWTVGCALYALICGTSAGAQAQDHFSFDRPPEALSQALTDVALRTGRNVVAPTELVRGRMAPALSGSFTAEEAVERLLAGTPLHYRAVNGTLVIEPRPFADDREASDRGTQGPADITVTGTRIRGAGSTSPVVVSTRRQLEESGVSDLADFTRILPQNYTGGQNRGIVGGGEQGGQQNLNDSASLNLRGLGVDATLTLLNGHRLAYDALDQGVDISAIPLAAIERLEVVADGASALYGSDAVGGVANIILRRDADNVEASARFGASTDGGDRQWQFGGVGGQRWRSGGFMVALDHSRASPIMAGQRGYTSSLDPSLTLTSRLRQTSGVFTAHQDVGPRLAVDLDASAMTRISVSQVPFFATDDVRDFGIVSRSHVRSWALTPTLRADLGGWRASLSATAARSRTFLDADNYFNSVPRNGRLLYANALKGVEAAGEGPLIALPGGDLRLAVGAGAREVSLHVRTVLTSSGQSTTTRDSTERRKLWFAYGELSVPLISPELGIAMVDRLTLSAALRHERWSGIAAVTTPKLGLVYRPIADVTLRATWGRSFKVPTLFQVNQAQAGVLLPGFIFNPRPAPAGSTVLLLAGSNPGLKPERAETWSATLELKPRAITGLSLRGTYFNVDYRDRIAIPVSGILGALGNPLYDALIDYGPSAADVSRITGSLPAGLSNQTGAPFDSSTVGAIINNGLRNTARQRADGIDLDGEYRIDLGGGERLLLTAAASYLRSRRQLAANQPLIDLAGTVFNPPHWRGRAGLAWTKRDAGLSAFVNHVGGTRDPRPAGQGKTAPFVTIDLNASFRPRTAAAALRGFEIRLSALNVLDQHPHFIRNASPDAPPFDSTNESPVGRFLGLAVRKIW